MLRLLPGSACDICGKYANQGARSEGEVRKHSHKNVSGRYLAFSAVEPANFGQSSELFEFGQGTNDTNVEFARTLGELHRGHAA